MADEYDGYACENQISIGENRVVFGSGSMTNFTYKIILPAMNWSEPSTIWYLHKLTSFRHIFMCNDDFLRTRNILIFICLKINLKKKHMSSTSIYLSSSLFFFFFFTFFVLSIFDSFPYFFCLRVFFVGGSFSLKSEAHHHTQYFHLPLYSGARV